ncbi:hypothetical protein L6R52_05360 [Myxococcota bacterium]|nr:hypothetical protein [Myxococcota bacterium]
MKDDRSSSSTGSPLLARWLDLAPSARRDPTPRAGAPSKTPAEPAPSAATLLAGVKADLLAKLPAPTVAALTRDLEAAIAPGATPVSPAILVQRLQVIEDVLEAVYLSPGAEPQRE